MTMNDSSGDRMIAPEVCSSTEHSVREEPASLEAGDDPEDEADEANPQVNPYRDENWEEDPPRICAEVDEPPRRQRPSVEDATPDEIAKEHTRMLVELSYEAHDFACDYFKMARGIDDRVAARARKLAVAIKLAGVTMKLVASTDKHLIDTDGE